MTLRDFLHKFRIKQKDFAAVVGVSDVMLSAYATGKVIPPLPKILRIEQASAGWVTPYDWGIDIGDGVKDGEGFSAAAEITKEKAQEITRRCLSEIGLALAYASACDVSDFGYPLEEVTDCIGCRGEQDSFCGDFRDRCDKIADSAMLLGENFLMNILTPLQFEPEDVDPAGWGSLRDPGSLLSRICLTALGACKARFSGNKGDAA